MAGTGPPPKKKSERRRRNKEKPPTELPAEGHAGEYPPLPATWSNTVLEKVQTSEGEELISKTVKITFLQSTRDWYDIWGASPMAVEFTAVDWNRLQRVAKLVDQYERKPSKDLMAEIRLQEASFGGTPMDRRRLGQVIGGEGKGKSGRQPRAASDKEAKARRARMRAAS